MDEPNEEHRVVPELYFLIAKFLSGGPLKATAQTLLKELESVEVLPRRLDWEGNEHTQSYEELASQYTEVPWTRLSSVCERALRLARLNPTAALPALPPTPSSPTTSTATTPTDNLKLTARLSLLSESLVRPKPKYASHIPDHTLVRRLQSRELGGAEMWRGASGLFPSRMLSGLQLQRRTLGHLSAVYCLVFDCTGRYVVTGADDLLVKVWSAVDARLLATLRGAGAEITDVCASRDGALLAAGSVERLVRVWCLATGAPRAVLAAHAGTITSVHWAPPAHDLRWLASTSTDGSVAFWTCSADGQFLSQPVQYVERMRPGACHMICAAWSAGGAFLAAGSADQHVRVYSVSGTPRRVLEVAVHSDAVDSIAWAHRGLRFISGSKDGSAALWTLHATQWRHVLLQPPPIDNAVRQADGKKLKVTMVSWDCSDQLVLTAVSDCTVRVWCARSAKHLRALRGHKDEAYVLEAHPFLPHVLLSAGHDGQLFVWDACRGEVIGHFHNRIEGQGSGAIFDAKWGGGAHVAASDSHGHLLLLGLGRGHRLLQQLPPELFFHTDYRPLVRDALGGALDEQTETPPHLMPPPFLVDVEGAPHPPGLQRLVPGRAHLALEQLVPAADAARARLDRMILALAAGDGTPPEARGQAGAHGGVWRGEGVRHTAGSWQSGDLLLAPNPRPLVPPLPQSQRQRVEAASAELNELEQSWWRREMRRRPVMISTAGAGEPAGPRARPGRRPRGPAERARPAPRPAQRPVARYREEPREADSASGSDTSDESVRLSASAHSSGDHSQATSADFSDSSSSSSSQYSDWEAGAALAPPARARRRRPQNRFSPSTSLAKRAPLPRSPPAASPRDARAAPAAAAEELPEAYRPGDWLTAVLPRKAPYHPQMGDECVYFRLGHQRYFEAVAEKDLYKINPRDKPWERTQVHEAELVKVVGIKYVIKPPRVVCLKLAATAPQGTKRSFTVRYHDMPDVIDFLVLKQQFVAGVAHRWSQGDRFRCCIDDSWWTGMVLDADAPPADAQRWDAAAAAAQFLALRVRWDNGEVERLSPWDLEPCDGRRAAGGGALPALPAELRAALYRAQAHEWPKGTREAACRAIADHIQQVMTLSAAEPFAAPVDLQLYPSYARVVPYPIDLSTIRARFENLFYRRVAAAQFDVRYLATNAETYNEPHSTIVRQARLVTDLLLNIISNWRDVDVVAKYHELCASYHSSDDEAKPSNSKSRGSCAGWRGQCGALLTELLAAPDSEPFRAPVEPHTAPDYLTIVSHPMDLGTVRGRLLRREYSSAAQFADDVRRVFSNSRLYNTNKRSRIYSMTVRLSALFEARWSRLWAALRLRRAPPPRPAPRAHRPRRTRQRSASSPSDSSMSEPLAAASRRALAAAAALRRDDSWDSDAPLVPSGKGKGVGKKSKSSSNSAEPGPSQPRPASSSSASPALNGASSSSSHSSRAEDIEVLEEELQDDEVELTYDEPDTRRTEARKRRRASTSGSSGSPGWQAAPSARTKRRRSWSWSSSSAASGAGPGAGAGRGGRRYSSDGSYHPRDDDDDAPLVQMRERQQNGDSGSDTDQRRRRPARGVSLRARRSPRRYNEDSDDDSANAISKRAPRRSANQPNQAANQANQASARQGYVPALPADHDYYSRAAHGSVGGDAAHAHHNGASGSALSVSSRGRVRKLTAKARGLLRERD